MLINIQPDAKIPKIRKFRFHDLQGFEYILKILPRILLLALLLSYAGLLYTNLCDTAGGSDSSGYLNYARRLSQGNLIERVKALDVFALREEFGDIFRPLGFTRNSARKDIIVPSYPAGMPLHMAAFAKILGWAKGPFLVSPVAALLGLLLIYFLARQLGLSPLFSVFSSIILAAFPAYLFQSIQPMSDVLATFWIMVALLALTLSHRRIGWAFLAGASFGMSVLIRPSDVLVVLAVLMILPKKPKTYLLFLAGAVPMGMFFLIMNHILYGGWFTTGYHSSVFFDLAAKNFPSHVQHYTYWLSVTLTPLIPAAWLMLAGWRAIALKNRALLFFWFAPLFLFFCFYKPYEAWWYLRFFLPGIPALILSFLLVIQSIHTALIKKGNRRRSLPLVGYVLSALLIGVVFLGEIRQVNKLGILAFDEGERVYKESCLRARREWPEKSIVLSFQMSGALTYYTDFIPCRYDWLDQKRFDDLKQRINRKEYHWYALLFSFEEKAFHQRVTGEWVKIGFLKDVGFWQFISDDFIR
jgi:hypothetical protein